MQKLKSHFKFNKQERSGIFFLLFSIVVLQVVYVFFVSSSFFQNPIEEGFFLDEKQQEQIAILKQKSLEKDTLKLYPFNPNYITDYKGYKLGMTIQEIDRLHDFRASNKYVNSDLEFQEVTKVSDSLLQLIAPYFKFPKWVNKKPQNFDKPISNLKNTTKRTRDIVYEDLNTVTAAELKKVNGIGDVLSVRIIKFRDRLGGFLEEDQLNDVYGLEPVVVKRVFEKYRLLTKPEIIKININTASASEISKLIYLNYQVSKNIIQFRENNGGIRSIDELIKIEGFPSEKINRISLYLAL